VVASASTLRRTDCAIVAISAVLPRALLDALIRLPRGARVMARWCVTIMIEFDALEMVSVLLQDGLQSGGHPRMRRTPSSSSTVKRYGVRTFA
jgi:hypothetical protein